MLIKPLIAICLTLGIAHASFGMDGSEQPFKTTQNEQNHTKKIFILENLENIKRSRSARDHQGGPINPSTAISWIPVIQHLLRVMEEGAQTPNIQELHRQIKYDLDRSNISDQWVLDVHFRYLALSSNMSTQEREFLSHLSHYQLIEGLLAQDSCGNPVALDPNKWSISRDKFGMNFFGISPQAYADSGLTDEIVKEVIQQLAIHMNNPIIYPSLGKALFHPEFIIKCWLDEIRLIGVPTSDVNTIHGEPASSLGTAFHDLLHAKTDVRRPALVSYTLSLVRKYMGDENHASACLGVLVSLAIKRYYLIMDCLRKAEKSVENDKYALAGLFFLTFEFPAFPESVFRGTNPSQVLDDIFMASFATFDEVDAWGNPEDIFHTSPFTGKSSLTAAQLEEIIVNRVIDDHNFIYCLPRDLYSKRNGEGNLIGFIEDGTSRKELRKGWLQSNSKVGIKQTPQFIIATVEIKDGKKFVYNIPTLFRKMRNFASVSGILKYAGVDLKPPVLKGENEDEDRKIALDFLRLVKAKVQGTMVYFTRKSKLFFETSHPGYRETYASAYAGQCEMLENQIPRLKSKVSKRDPSMNEFLTP